MSDPISTRKPRKRHPAGSLTGFVLFSGGLALQFFPASLPAIQIPASTSTTSAKAPATDIPVSHTQHEAEVTFASGLLTIAANNSSLNSIVREVARQTGMKVTGSVAEDRVFGTYGPADPQRVLATLLDGTGSNFLIESSKSDAPVQLVLTRRTGAPSPPNPNSASSGDTDDDQVPPPPPSAAPGNNAPRPRASAFPGSVPPNPAATQPSATDQTVVFPPVDGSSTPATATTTPSDTSNPTDTSGDSVKTPQQIFEQLQRLRQQGAGNASQPQ